MNTELSSAGFLYTIHVDDSNLFHRFFGRRACIRGYEENSEETKSVNDKPAKKEIKSSKSKKEEKDKKIKF